MNNNKVNYANSEKKDCRCNIKALREILGLFKGVAETDLEVNIVTKADKFKGFIFDLTEDIVYLSPSINSRPYEFIPLSNIVAVFVNNITPKPLCHKLKEKIEYYLNSTDTLNHCCLTDGITNTLHSIRRFNDSKHHLCFNLNTLLTTSLGTFFVDIADITKINKDVIFLASKNDYAIVVTRAIDSIFLSKDKIDNSISFKNVVASEKEDSTSGQSSSDSNTSEENNSALNQSFTDSNASEEVSNN